MRHLIIGVVLIAFVSELFGQKPVLGIPAGHTAAVTAVAYASNGQYVLTGSMDEQAKLWTKNGQVIHTIDQLGGPITYVGFSPQCNFFWVSTRETTQVYKFDGTPLLKAREQPLFSPNDQLVYYLKEDEDGKLTGILWNESTSEETEFDGETTVPMAFSPDSKYLLVSKNTQQTRFLWGLLSGQDIRENEVELELWTSAGKRKERFQVDQRGLAKARFFPNKDRIGVSYLDGTVTVYNFSGKKIQTLGKTRREMIFISVDTTIYDIFWTDLGFSADGNTMYTSNVFGNTFIPNLDSLSDDDNGKKQEINPFERMEFKKHDFPHITSISPDGKTFLLRYNVNNQVALMKPDGTILMHFNDVYGTSKRQDLIQDIQSRGHTVCYSPDGKELLIGYQSGYAEIRDLNGRVIRQFKSETQLPLAALQAGRERRFFIQTLRKPEGSFIQKRDAAQLAAMADRNPIEKSVKNPGDVQFADNFISFSIPEVINADTLWYEIDLAQNEVQAIADSTVRRFLKSDQKLQHLYRQMNSPKNEFISHSNKYIITGVEDPNKQLRGMITSIHREDNTAGMVSIEEAGRPGMQKVHNFFDNINSVCDVALSPDDKKLLISPSYEAPRIWNMGCLMGSKLSLRTRDIRSAADKFVNDSCVISQFEDIPQEAYFHAFAESGNYILMSNYPKEINPDSTFNYHKEFRKMDLDGNMALEYTGHRLPIKNAVFALSDEVVVSWAPDNTIKFWPGFRPDSSKTGIKELATLEIFNNGEWVITTPGGHFDASPGGMREMYYVIGDEIIELEQIKEFYYSPALLPKLLLEPQRVRSIVLDSMELFPLVDLVLDSTNHKLKINLTERSGGIGNVSVYLNGKLRVTDAPLARRMRSDSLKREVDLREHTAFFLQDTTNKIVVRAYNAANLYKSPADSVLYTPPPISVLSKGSTSDSTNTDETPPPTASGPYRPSLHAIVVGTGKYAADNLNLNYAGKDALSMASALKQAGETLFGPDRTNIYLFTTDTSVAEMQPRKENIRKAFDQIRSTPARAEDLLIVYFSGHGVSYGSADKASFYLLTMESTTSKLSDPKIRESQTLSAGELTDMINSIPPNKQVLILDACNSGEMISFTRKEGSKNLDPSQVKAFDQMKDRSGMFVLAGAAADKLSFEANEFGHGLLTYSLLQGMNGLQRQADGVIDARSLFEFALSEVPNLSKGLPGSAGAQKPMLASPEEGTFPLGRVIGELKVPPPNPKKVFIRSFFLDSNKLTDHLKLTDKLDFEMQVLTAKPVQAPIIYANIPEYAQGYSFKGLYTVDGSNNVTLTAKLFKGNQQVGDNITLSGTSDNVAEIIEELIFIAEENLN